MPASILSRAPGAKPTDSGVAFGSGASVATRVCACSDASVAESSSDQQGSAIDEMTHGCALFDLHDLDRDAIGAFDHRRPRVAPRVDLFEELHVSAFNRATV